MHEGYRNLESKKKGKECKGWTFFFGSSLANLHTLDTNIRNIHKHKLGSIGEGGYYWGEGRGEAGLEVERGRGKAGSTRLPDCSHLCLFDSLSSSPCSSEAFHVGYE